MLANYSNSLELLEAVQREQLYKKLIQQIKKDFDLANIAIEVPSEITPTALKSVVHEKLYVLLVERFDQYLNLLYVIDISEREVKNIQAMDAVDVTAEVTFLLLKREWQKVWYKAKYSS